MSALLASPALAAASPFTASRGAQCTRRAAAGRLLVAAAQQQQPPPQQQQQQWRQQAAAASALAASLAASPAALAAALTATADPQAQQAAQLVVELAALDSKTAGRLALVLKPALSVASLLMIVRIVMSWYPELDGKSMPWSIVYTPTEPILKATRKLVPPFNGLDVSPIVWVALLSFLSEILTGPQGILSLIARKGI